MRLLCLSAVALLLPAAHSFTADRVLSRALGAARDKIDAIHKSIEGGEEVSNLGVEIDELVLEAGANLEEEAKEQGMNPKDLELQKYLLYSQLEGPLSMVYLKHLRNMRERALEEFRTEGSGGQSEAAEFEAMLAADERFARAAEQAKPVQCLGLFDASFDFATERNELQELLREVAVRTKSITDARLEAARQQADVLKYLRKQQEELAECQRMQYSQSSPWSLGCAYKLPFTNINLSGTYQGGKTKLVVSMVEEPLLNTITQDQGFVTGVDEGAVGFSVNMNLR